MNTERTPYGAEDSESDDSAAVSFGNGPAFRPIPRIERPAPAPAPKREEVPRIPSGVLFDRALETVRTDKTKSTEEKDDDEEEDESVTPPRAVTPSAPVKPVLAPKPRVEAPAPMLAPTESSDVGTHTPLQHESTAGSHLPDLGEFTARLPETPPVPEVQPPQPTAERAPAEQHPALPATENEPLTHTYPTETAADLPGWPEETGEASDPPPQPTPPRNTPNASEYGQFEALPSNVLNATATESDPSYASSVATTSVGGRPSAPPSGAAGGGGMPPGSQPPNNHNAYFGMSGYNANTGGGGGYGGGGGGYNPNAAPNPNVQPRYEVVQNITQKKKGNIWPYVAILGENIARKRADRKLKKEMSERMDQQDHVQEASNANQLRLERQQQEMLSEQRKQAIREAHRPSGNEWGVPRPVSAGGAGATPGQRMPGEHAPIAGAGIAGRPEQPMPMQTAEQQMEQPGELASQGAGRERHSAWHTYYEDENGRQIPGVEYGKGFKQEQREIVRDHTGDNVVAGVAAAAGVAGATARGGGGASGGGGSGGAAGQPGAYYGYGPTPQGSQPQQYQPTLPSDMTTPGLPAGASRTDPQHQLPEHTKKSNLPGPLFWLMVGLIILAFFAAALI
jgi:hypothetical protein